MASILILCSGELLGAVERIPTQVLFGAAHYAHPQISGDGQYLAYLLTDHGVSNIWLRTLGMEDDRQITLSERGIWRYIWSASSRYIIYWGDTDGDEQWHMYAIDLEKSTVRDCTPYDGIQARLIALSPQHPDQVLIALNLREKSIHDVYRVSLKTGELTLVEHNTGTIVRWLADQQLEIRAAVSLNRHGGTDVLVRAHKDKPWKTLIEWNAEEALASKPLAYAPTGNCLYVLDTRYSNTTQLTKVAIQTGQATVLGHDKRYDIDALLLDPKTDELQGFYVSKVQREFIPCQPRIIKDCEHVRSLDTGDMYIVSRSHDDTLWVVSFVKDTGPITSYVYNRVDHSATYLFASKEELNRYTLAPREHICIRSRDGLLLEGYCTYPVGVLRHNLPLVLMVHGGPWSRDKGGWDAEAQWLANRGYVCLQVNYRGSTGYGKQFISAGDKEWGGKMLDDLVDAVQWAIDAGIADDSRIAIWGSSYGGYAALCGATMTNLFACAIDASGPSNLMTQLGGLPAYWAPYQSFFHQRIGHPIVDEELLKKRSPFFYVQNSSTPLFIVQGACDSRVKRSEVEMFVNTLRDKNIVHEYLEFGDEGHEIRRESNRIMFYERVEKFLTEHLGEATSLV